MISMRTIAPAGLVAAVAALAVATAPAAVAQTTQLMCATTGATATVCQTDGNAQLSAAPPDVDYGAQDPFLDPDVLLFRDGGVGTHGGDFGPAPMAGAGHGGFGGGRR